MSDNDPLRRLRELCLPGPLRGDQQLRLAVERDDVGEEYRPDLEIERTLRFPDRPHPKIILFGGRGSGKSTELSRLEQSFGDRFLMVGVDLGMNAVQRDRMTAEELVVLVGVGVARAAAEVWGLDLGPELRVLQGAIQPLLKDPDLRLDLGELFKSLALFGTTLIDPSGTAGAGTLIARNLLTATASPLKATVDLGGLLDRSRHPDQSQRILDAANALLDAVARRGSRPPLVLLDELDKTETSEQSMSLLTDHTMLPSLSCAMVIAGPTRLQQSTLRNRLKDHYNLEQLFHVRCWQRGAPEEPDLPLRPEPEGMDKLREIVRRRVEAAGAELRELFTEPALDMVLSSSGGVVRDLLRLVQLAAQSAQVDGARRIEARSADRARNKLRREFELVLDERRRACLREVRRTQLLNSVHDQMLPLLDDNYIVAYSNHSVWYYPHAITLGFL